MSWIALTFVACLAGHPDRCEPVELGAPGLLTECQMHAQAVIAAWLDQHDGYEWRGAYRCDVGRTA